MANDTREDHGSYYPGAKVIVSGSGTSGTATDVSGKVDRVTIGEIGDTYTLKTVKEKVDKLIKAVAPVASCLAAMLYMSTAMAATEVFEDIPSNARVVVSEDDPIALAAIPEVVGTATNAAVETAKKYADAAVAVEASNRADAVEGVLVRSKSYTDAATNALAAKIPVVDLEPYATRTWVETKGYVTSDALGGVATKDWVSDQGYLTLLAMTPYATMDWVLGKGYATASDIKGLATKSELDALKRMYADTNGVTRLWSEDGLTMTDGTGVVWNVTWNVVTNWVSLSNGVVFAQVKDQMGFDKWVSQGIYTNALGQSSSAQIHFEGGVFSIFLDAHAGSTGTFEVSPGQVLVDAHDYGYNDTFRNSTVRVPAFAFRSMVVTNTVGYVDNGTITDGTNTITAAGAATSAGIGKGYWMVRLIPDGAWLKLVPVPESGTAWWRDGATNSYVYDDSSLPGGQDGMWKVSVDDASHTLHIPAERYEAFSDSNAEGYYVPDRKTLATVDQIPTTPEQIGAYTRDEVDAKVTNAVLPTNPTFSNAVLSVGLNIDTNSVAVLNDIANTFGGFPIEGTATTVGGLLAALAAAVAWLKKNKADKATTLAGYGITDAATMASLAPEYSPSSAYSVGAFVYHNGNIYQCTTAIADGGEAWNSAHWELRKLDDFFTESNSLLNGRLAYSRNATGLKDRAFNTLSFDGTEYNLSTALAAVTPTASGQPRDLLIVATATAATTISFTAGTIKGDKPTIDGSGTWLITLTEYASGVWYCRQIKMEDAA